MEVLYTFFLLALLLEIFLFFGITVNGTFFKVHFSVFAIVYKKTIDFYILTLYSATLLK